LPRRFPVGFWGVGAFLRRPGPCAGVLGRSYLRGSRLCGGSPPRSSRNLVVSQALCGARRDARSSGRSPPYGFLPEALAAPFPLRKPCKAYEAEEFVGIRRGAAEVPPARATLLLGRAVHERVVSRPPPPYKGTPFCPGGQAPSGRPRPHRRRSHLRGSRLYGGSPPRSSWNLAGARARPCRALQPPPRPVLHSAGLPCRALRGSVLSGGSPPRLTWAGRGGVGGRAGGARGVLSGPRVLPGPEPRPRPKNFATRSGAPYRVAGPPGCSPCTQTIAPSPLIRIPPRSAEALAQRGGRVQTATLLGFADRRLWRTGGLSELQSRGGAGATAGGA
jgi:hypothetical protein